MGGGDGQNFKEDGFAKILVNEGGGLEKLWYNSSTLTISTRILLGAS